MAVGPPPAIGAEPDELQTVAEDFITAEVCDAVPDYVRRCIVKVIHLPALLAPNMVVRLNVPIEASRSKTRLEPADHPDFGELVQVPVDRTQADAGQTPADNLVKVGRGGVG
jgi:hypothetical protein